MDDISDAFDTRLKPGSLPAALRTVHASAAAELARNAGCKTNQAHLQLIVNSRIQAACAAGKHLLTLPFDGLTRPAADDSKLAVLDHLREHGYQIPPTELPDDAVVSWAHCTCPADA